MRAAREISALLSRPLRAPDCSYTPVPTKISVPVAVEEPALCPRYVGHFVADVKVGTSPRWLRRRLALCRFGQSQRPFRRLARTRLVAEHAPCGSERLFFHLPDEEKPSYNGIQLINSAVILRYIKQLLRRDAKYAPFTFAASEHPVYEELEMPAAGVTLQTRIGGIIDRIDIKGDILRIVDYKTGGSADTPPDVESLFTPDKKRSNYVFQTFLYAAIVCRKLRENHDTRRVAPSLLYIHQAASENYTPVIRMGGRGKAEEVYDFARHEATFREYLNRLITEIFSPETAFEQTTITDKCIFCDFKELCKR